MLHSGSFRGTRHGCTPADPEQPGVHATAPRILAAAGAALRRRFSNGPGHGAVTTIRTG